MYGKQNLLVLHVTSPVRAPSRPQRGDWTRVPAASDGGEWGSGRQVGLERHSCDNWFASFVRVSGELAHAARRSNLYLSIDKEWNRPLTGIAQELPFVSSCRYFTHNSVSSLGAGDAMHGVRDGTYVIDIPVFLWQGLQTIRTKQFEGAARHCRVSVRCSQPYRCTLH